MTNQDLKKLIRIQRAKLHFKKTYPVSVAFPVDVSVCYFNFAAIRGGRILLFIYLFKPSFKTLHKSEHRLVNEN